MKDAATCDNSYVLQNQAYHHTFERKLQAAALLHAYTATQSPYKLLGES